jgi:hypothetical protein
MTGIIIIVSLFVSSYLYEPLWFDTRPHYYVKTFQTPEACAQAKKASDLEIAFPDAFHKGNVCVPKGNYSGNSDLYSTKEN